MRRHRRRWLLGLLLAVAGAAALGFSLWGRAELPNIVIITVESLRVDHVGCMGAPLATTPHLDAFAEEALVYDDAHSVTSWTLASHASIFTGLYPTAHQATGPLDRLGTSYETIAEVLAGRGYQCAGVVSGPYLRKNHQLDQGFEYYDEAPSATDHNAAHSAVTNARMQAGMVRFLKEKRDDRPLFLFGYYWDPHYDFLPPPPFDETFVTPTCQKIDVRGFGTTQTVNAAIRPGQLEYVKSQYAGEVLCTHGYLGQLFATLKEQGLWENSLIIITADHGEEFFDHGQKGHKNNIYAETVHVPLIVKYPGKDGPRGHDSRLVSHVDLLPTILDLIGSRPGIPLHGISLLDEPPRSERTIHYELLEKWYTKMPGAEETTTTSRLWFGARRGDHKYVVNNHGLQKLFNVAQDPREQTDLLADEPQQVALLNQTIDRWYKDMQLCARLFTAGGRSQMSAEDIERLKSVGYIRD